LKNCKEAAENVDIFSKIEKSTAYKTHFGFSNKGSEMHHFSSTAISF